MTVSPPSRITGFEDIPWGAPLDAIRTTYGPPLAEERVVNGVEYAYSIPRAGIAVEVEFTVHDRYGLIIGCLVVPFTGGAEGRRVFEGYRDAIREAFPDLPPVETREVEEDSLAFDDALARGLASWCVEWRDPSGRARIELLLWPSAEVFWVSYYGPHADAWEEERFLAERGRDGADGDSAGW